MANTKKLCITLLSSILLVLLILLSGCATSAEENSTTNTNSTNVINNSQEEKPEQKQENNEQHSATNSSSSTKSYSSFTNKFGTATTVCAHSGCTNYISSTGDTNCCTTHSNNCLDCRKYIDEDAMYCISCLTKAANQAKEYTPSKTNTPSCEVCSKSGTKSIIGISGQTEYYCTQHYNEMKDLFEILTGY